MVAHTGRKVSTIKYTKPTSDDRYLKKSHDPPPSKKKSLVTCIYLHDYSNLFKVIFIKD